MIETRPDSTLVTTAECLHRFRNTVSDIPLPKRFTFPFYYDPHPLSVIAAKELQDRLQSQMLGLHDFGINNKPSNSGIGKMFGILVVKDKNDELGYLAAFSGKLANRNDHPGFVPPIYDMLQPEGFFNQGMLVLNDINQEVLLLEKDPSLIEVKAQYDELKTEVDSILRREKKANKEAKQNRKSRKRHGEQNLSSAEVELLKKELAVESLEAKKSYNAISKYWEIKLFYAQIEVERYEDRIKELKQKRKSISNDLQQQLFDQYDFLNRACETKNVLEIFKETPLRIPPSGAGDCAAPKLFQYAFRNGLEPISMAEFWWGKSPKSEIRKHGHFYPSCRGKCEPILNHMLQGIEMDPNPMLINPALGKTIDMIYEDDVMAIINKPPDMLSVPGKTISDSVATRMKARFPNATGPLIVHRLDMSTSGLLVIAKTKDIHKILQSQFINRTVKKRYVALLEGEIKPESGTINLPLRVDLDDRPRQLVCHEHGKQGETRWEVINRSEQGTRVYFYPITGRTHQLRVHASHPDGLNTPIVGDDLYGRKGERLHLHAEWIQFQHPVSGKEMEVSVPAEF